MQITPNGRTGLLAGHSGVRQGRHRNLRLTIPAREVLKVHGATVTPEPPEDGIPLYTVELGAKVPPGLVAVRIVGSYHIALRTADEPEYPGEVPTLWENVDFAPCPKCGAPLVWYEAGYVPGYRVCAGPKHHHCLVA